jgi:uncharacterized membrane protein
VVADVETDMRTAQAAAAQTGHDTGVIQAEARSSADQGWRSAAGQAGRRSGAGDRRRPTAPLEIRRRAAVVMVGWMAAASAMGVAMVLARVWYTDTLDYGFLVWNLVLAWVPVVFAVVATIAAASRRRVSNVVLAFSALVWLLFFPNSPYIVTDFQHIGEIGTGVPTWYDVMLVVWFAFAGLLLGVVSLYLMQRLVERAFGSRAGWWFVLGVTALASLGIYVGRFLRWNSWDVFANPRAVADPIWERLRDPGGNDRLFAFCLLYALFFLFVYGSLRLFARFVRDVGSSVPAETESGDETTPTGTRT